MNDLPRINRIETLLEGRFLSLEKVHFTDETGKERNWERVSRVNSQGAVMIIPHILPQDEYVLVRQFRAPTQRYTIEFPAGLIDPGEDAGKTAVRELAEETGFEGRITEILPASYSSPGLSPETITTVKMSIDGNRYPEGLPQAHPEENEHIEVLRVPVSRLRAFLMERIASGDGTDAKLFAYCR